MIKTIIILLVAVTIGTTGDLMLSRGMRALNEDIHFNAWNVIPFFVRTFQSGTVWMGICCMAVFFLLYLVALSRAEVSLVLPLTACSYILTAIFARYFLHEDVNFVRIMGTALIFSGVVLVALSSKTTAVNSVSELPEKSDTVVSSTSSTQHVN